MSIEVKRFVRADWSWARLPSAHARHFDADGNIVFRKRRDPSRFKMAERVAGAIHRSREVPPKAWTREAPRGVAATRMGGLPKKWSGPRKKGGNKE